MSNSVALSAEEQYLLELINRARLDPAAEAARYKITLNEGLSAGTITATAKQVLAPQSQLDDAAFAHSRWMLTSGTFSHTGAQGSMPWDRAADQNYTRASVGENISVSMSTRNSFPSVATIDDHHMRLFLSAGHRENILAGMFREAGLSVEVDRFNYQGNSYFASMLTQMFGLQAFRGPILTGVVYRDRDGDKFYDIGEGLGQSRFSVNGRTAFSAAAGGYGVETSGGSSERVTGVTTTGKAFAVDVNMSRGNVKLDLIDDREFLTSGSLTLVSGIGRATALGTDALALTGSAAMNILTGNKAANVIRGMAGADTIYGGAGHDQLYGGSNNDVIYGGTGNDRLYGDSHNDRLYGDAGNDLLYGGTGNDLLYGGTGVDRLFGGDGNDQLYGGDQNDTLTGGAGHDRLEGGTGDDRLLGELGNDTLYGQAGADWLYGADGFDFLYGGDGVDRLYGGAGNDQLYGGAQNDYLYGDAGHDRLYGDAGNDRLYGGTGNDQLYGGAGNDLLFGGDGNDRMQGGAGRDQLTGGAGADRFVFGKGAGSDTVMDVSLRQGDRLSFDDNLWAGQSLTAAGVIRKFAVLTPAGVVIDFGNGDQVLLAGLSSLSGLSGALDIF